MAVHSQSAFAAPVPWLSTGLAVVSNDAPTTALHPAWSCGVTPATTWRSMELPGGHFDFTGLDAMLAMQRANGISNTILKIWSPPDDVTPSNYVTRIARLVNHMAAHISGAGVPPANLWILPDNEPDHTSDGFIRHAAILKACFTLSRGRLKIVGCALQDRRPEAFHELAMLGCTNWCDAISFHYYDNWQMSPMLPWPGNGARDTVLNDLTSIAKLFPDKPIFCDEFGVALNTDRTRAAILQILAAGVTMIQPFQWQGDMRNPGVDVSQYHGDEPSQFYQCWDYTSNRPAPYAQCILDLAAAIPGVPNAVGRDALLGVRSPVPVP